MSPRYALYFAPPADTALWRAGSRWLGRDAQGDAALEQPPVPGYSRERIAVLTHLPRRYGFHATLKAPFALAPDRSIAQLREALQAWCRGCARFLLPPLEVAVLSGFLALRPTAPSPVLQALADRCVVAFDRFRGPPTDDELERRRSAGLTPRQAWLLAQYGYPYVLDEYRFHMTLTERLDARDQAGLLPWLREHFAYVLAEPVLVQDICVFVQERPGARFRILDRFSIGF